MKFALFLCLAFAIAVESLWPGGAQVIDVLEDDPEVDLKKECKKDDDCDKEECCFMTFAQCIPKKQEGESCNPLSKCYYRCKDGLECRKVDAGIYRCARPGAPLPEPEASGSGEAV